MRHDSLPPVRAHVVLNRPESASADPRQRAEALPDRFEEVFHVRPRMQGQPTMAAAQGNHWIWESAPQIPAAARTSRNRRSQVSNTPALHTTSSAIPVFRHRPSLHNRVFTRTRTTRTHPLTFACRSFCAGMPCADPGRQLPLVRSTSQADQRDSCQCCARFRIAIFRPVASPPPGGPVDAS